MTWREHLVERIKPDNNMWQDLQTLGAKILHKGSVHPALKAWSQGAVGNKTFRQISDEFAEIVIPRVWEREGRKSVASGRETLDLSEESASHSSARRTSKASSALGVASY